MRPRRKKGDPEIRDRPKTEPKGRRGLVNRPGSRKERSLLQPTPETDLPGSPGPLYASPGPLSATRPALRKSRPALLNPGRFTQVPVPSVPADGEDYLPSFPPLPAWAARAGVESYMEMKSTEPKLVRG